VFQSLVAEKPMRPSKIAVLSSVTDTLPTEVIVSYSSSLGVAAIIGHNSKAVNICLLTYQKQYVFFGCVATSAFYPRPEETGFYGTEG